MTVGIAAMAERSKAMVLAADRQMTVGDTRYEGRIAKKREIGYGWRFLFEDSATRADELSTEIIERLSDRSTTGPITEREMRVGVKAAFLELRKRTVKKAKDEFDLGILLLGFDEKNEAVGFRFFEWGEEETIRDIGFAAIGSGRDAALAALAHYGAPMDDPLWRVLYKVYEAKRRADRLITSVGATTDMWIMTEHARRQGEPNGDFLMPPAGPIPVPVRIIQKFGEIFDWSTAPPWDRPSEPGWWQGTLIEYAAGVMRGENPL